MCVAVLIGFRPSQPPAAAPLCRGFRAGVRVPVPPSAVRPRAGGAPRPRSGLQEPVQDFSAWGFGDLHLMVLEFLGLGLVVQLSPMPGMHPCQGFTL